MEVHDMFAPERISRLSPGRAEARSSGHINMHGGHIPYQPGMKCSEQDSNVDARVGAIPSICSESTG